MWTVKNHDDFDAEYDGLPVAVREELLVYMGLLKKYGPKLGRPAVDTLNGSKYDNMKELRFNPTSPRVPASVFSFI